MGIEKAILLVDDVSFHLQFAKIVILLHAITFAVEGVVLDLALATKT